MLAIVPVVSALLGAEAVAGAAVAGAVDVNAEAEAEGSTALPDVGTLLTAVGAAVGRAPAVLGALGAELDAELSGAAFCDADGLAVLAGGSSPDNG